MRTLTHPLCLAFALLCGLLASPLAVAGKGELSFEIGTLANHDPAYARFSRRGDMPSYGVRLGANLTDQLLIVGGWHRAAQGITLYSPDGEQVVQSAFFADQFTLGPKAEFPIFRNRIVPYVLTQALLFRGVMKFDDDPTTPHNPGQVKATALTPGVLGMGGFEIRSGLDRSRPSAAFLFELGYGWAARGQYDDVGSLRPGGFALRSGFGVRL